MSLGTTSNMEWLSGPGGSGSVEYNAGHGIVIDNANHVISVDQSEIQDKLTAGDHITITGNVISASGQVQSDWNQADSGAVDYIRNKPNLATVATSGNYDDLQNKPTIPAAPVQSNWTESDSSSLAYIQNKPSLATVATTGAYSDLTGTPTINNVPAVTSNDDSKVLKASYSGGVGSYSWETESAGGVTDVEVDGTSVVSGGVASITMPTELVPTVTSSDDGKVLTATYSGGTGSYAWAAAQGGTTYTAGNMISLANDAVAVSTTAGITDIQQVAALPENPVSTVLYLIPET